MFFESICCQITAVSDSVYGLYFKVIAMLHGEGVKNFERIGFRFTVSTLEEKLIFSL